MSTQYQTGISLLAPTHSIAKKFFATFGWQLRVQTCNLQIRRLISISKISWILHPNGFLSDMQSMLEENEFQAFPREWWHKRQLEESYPEWIISYKCIQFCPERRVCNNPVNGLRGRGHLSSACSQLANGHHQLRGLRGLLTSDKESHTRVIIFLLVRSYIIIYLSYLSLDLNGDHHMDASLNVCDVLEEK